MIRYLIFILVLAGCSAEQAPVEATADPVVVYVAYQDSDQIRAAFDRFTEETGIPVIDRRGETRAIVDDLIENRVSPPADLLVTNSVVPAWRAAEESALRPLYSDAVDQHVPAWAMDPDNYWIAISADHAVVAYSGERPFAAGVVDLNHDRFNNKLCLSSSGNAINRAVIAGLLDDMDTRTAERVVRMWMSNLAQHPFATEEELASAIASGECYVGVMSASVADQTGVEYYAPSRQFADIEAVGVGRHARNPDGAARLAEWLILQNQWVEPSSELVDNVGQVGRYWEDAVKLVERARYF